MDQTTAHSGTLLSHRLSNERRLEPSGRMILTPRTAARRPLGRGPPDAAGPAAGGRVGPAPRRPGSSLRAAGWRSCVAGADSRSPSSPACSAYPRRRCTAGKRPAGRSPSEPVRRTHCRCCTRKSRNARLSDPARSWPERRGRRAVRPRLAHSRRAAPVRILAGYSRDRDSSVQVSAATLLASQLRRRPAWVSRLFGVQDQPERLRSAKSGKPATTHMNDCTSIRSRAPRGRSRSRSRLLRVSSRS